MFKIYESLRESAALKIAGNYGEDSQNAYYPVVLGRQQAGEEYADDKVEIFR